MNGTGTNSYVAVVHQLVQAENTVTVTVTDVVQYSVSVDSGETCVLHHANSYRYKYYTRYSRN
jgi:hypothetical protein